MVKKNEPFLRLFCRFIKFLEPTIRGIKSVVPRKSNHSKLFTGCFTYKVNRSQREKQMSSELLGSIVLKIINAYDWLFFKSLFFRGSHSPFRVFALCTIFVRMPGFEPKLLGPHFPKVILMISTFMQFVRNTNKHLKLLQRIQENSPYSWQHR